MPELNSCAGCGGTLWQESNGEPRFCDACLSDGTAKATEKVAEQAVTEAEAGTDKVEKRRSSR